MTIPRSPSDRMQAESQRDRLRREASEAANGYDRRLSTIDRSAVERSWRQRQQNEQADTARRESRPWSSGSYNRTPDTAPQRSYGGDRRSYGGASMGNGTQSRPAPSPRVEQRSAPQPSRSQPSGGNRGGDAFRGGGRAGQRQ
jgi:hypothetical protein